MEDLNQFNFEVLAIRWFRFYRKNAVFILIFGLIGMALGYAYHSSKTPVFESKAVIYSSHLNQARLIQIGSDLSELTLSKSYEAISKQIDLPVEKTSALRSLEFSAIEVKSVNKASIGEFDNDYAYNCVEINLSTTETEVIGDLQVGIMYYLVNNPFIQKIEKNREDNIAGMLEKIEGQLSALEKIQEQAMVKEENTQGLVINNEGSSISRDMIYLLDKKSSLEEELKLQSIEYIKPFNIPEKPGSKKMILLAAGFLVGLLFGIGIAVLRKVNAMY